VSVLSPCDELVHDRMGRGLVPPAGLILAAVFGAGAAVVPGVAFPVIGAVGLLTVALCRPRAILYMSPLLVALPSGGVWADHLGQYRTRLGVLLLLALVALLVSRRGRSTRSAAVALPLLGIGGSLTYHLLTQSFLTPLTTRALEVALAVVCGLLAFRQTRLDGTTVAVFGRVVVVFMSAQVSIAAAQFVFRDPLLMASALSAQAMSEASNISGLFRGIGTYYHGNSLGLALALSLPFALRLHLDPHKRWRALAPAATVVMLLGVVFTLSRGALAVTVLVLSAHAALNQHRVRRALGALAALGLVALAGLWIPAIGAAIARFTTTQSDVRDAGSGLARNANMGAAWDGFAASPLLGHGFGSSAAMGAEYGGYTGLGAHNTYLDVLQGGGILLMACFVWLAVQSFRPYVSAKRRVDPLWLVAPAVLTYGMVESVLQASFVVLIAVAHCLVLALMDGQRGGRRADLARVAVP
jgi:O-antigen ligase